MGQRIAASLFHEIPSKSCFTDIEAVQNYSFLLTLAFFREVLACSQHSRNTLRSVLHCCQSSSSCAFSSGKVWKLPNPFQWKELSRSSQCRYLFFLETYPLLVFSSFFPHNTSYFSLIHLLEYNILLLTDVVTPVYKVIHFTKGWDFKS